VTSRTRTVEICETNDGWVVDGGKTYSAAVKALAAVKRQDKKAVKNGLDYAATVVTWKPKSHIGTLVVKTLTA
jgi:hydroxymethylpyrimidine/phosphomethylpyrimidine kinase